MILENLGVSGYTNKTSTEMKNIIILLLLNLIFTGIKATPQCTDVIIYNGDTLKLYCFPFEKHPEERISDFRYLFGDSCEKGGSWGCLRGYVATWEIDENGQLYLVRVNGGERHRCKFKGCISI